MMIAKVTGSLVATQKVETMVGHKLMLVELYRLDPATRSSLVTSGRVLVAVDTVGAGEGEMVLITQGSSARLTPETKTLPVDTVIIGILDTVHVAQTCVYNKEQSLIMVQIDETLIRSVVEQVLSRMGGTVPPSSNGSYQGRFGLFSDVPSAVAAAREAFERLSGMTIDDRRRIIEHIRRISIEQCVELGTMEMEETKIGRLQHKIEKLKTLGERSLGVEFLRSEVFSGDHGLAVIEHAPFGVIGAVTPVTHSLPTITGNAVSMIAGGNTLVVNPHPGGKKVAAEGVRRFNEAIYRDLGVDNLICVIVEPTLETAEALFKHRDIALICVTGGPAVARAAMQQAKRAVVAGPGNPPVVVDETAELDRAARCHHHRGRLRQQPAVHRREGSLRRRVGLRRHAVGHGAGRGRAAVRQGDRRPDEGRHRQRGRRRPQARRGGQGLHRQGRRRAGQGDRQDGSGQYRSDLRRDGRIEPVRAGRADDALPALRPLPRTWTRRLPRPRRPSTVSAIRPSSIRRT